jgi:hypothetical protein
VVPGRLDLRLGESLFRGTSSHVSECPDLGPECLSPSPPAPYWHDVAVWFSETSLDASLGLTDWLAVDGRFAVRVVDVSPAFRELDGTEKLGVSDLHHRRETLAGPTDPWLFLRVAAQRGPLVTSARVGVSFPLGQTAEDPYALGRRGIPHQHIQFGSGTFMPLVGASLALVLTRATLALSGLGQFSLSTNENGFRAPSRTFGVLRASFPLLDGKLTPFGSTDVMWETAELWGGRVGADGVERGQIFAGVGLSWLFSSPWQVEGSFRGRVASFGGAMLDSVGFFQLALSTRFDLWGSDASSSPRPVVLQP